MVPPVATMVRCWSIGVFRGLAMSLSLAVGRGTPGARDEGRGKSGDGGGGGGDATDCLEPPFPRPSPLVPTLYLNNYPRPASARRASRWTSAATAHDPRSGAQRRRAAGRFRRAAPIRRGA